MKLRGIAIGVPELVIILGLLLVFLSGFLPEGSQKAKSKEIPLLYQEVGTIGGTGFSYIHISLGSGFTLSKGVEGTPIVYRKGPVEIAKGVFTTEEHLIEFSVPNLNEISSTTFEAEVVDTNGYAPLFIYLNGKEVWKGYAKKGEKIVVPLPMDLIRASNTLKISCGSSGWRIWAPAYYVLENIQIAEKVSTGEKVSLSFELTPAELANFYSANFYSPIVPKIPGEMVITLNGEKVIYRGVPNMKIFVVPFSSGLKEGENTLEIQLLSDGEYEFRDPQVVIINQKNATAGVSYPLNIPQDYLRALKSGVLVGEIEIKVNKAGDTPLTIILSSDVERKIYEGIPNPGVMVLRFTGDEVSDRNTLILRSTSIYEIEYIKVRLVKA